METADVTVMDVRPSEIRFKQDSIKSTFQDGRNVNKTANQLSEGQISADSIPRISITKKNNKYYSFDNRRLYVFRVAEYRGALSRIRVNVVPSHRFDEETFTTEDDGRTVQVRNGRTLPHYKQNWLTSPRAYFQSGDPLCGISDVDEEISPRHRDDFMSTARPNNSFCSCTIL